MKKLIVLLCLIISTFMCSCNNSNNTVNSHQSETSIIPTNDTQVQTELESINSNSNINGSFVINIDETLIMDTIQELCKSPRPVGSPEEKASCDYINSLLIDYGYETTIQEFPVYKVEKGYDNFGYRNQNFFVLNPNDTEPIAYGHNLIATKPSENLTNKTLILSAHYDTNPGSIGAIDNASGTSVLLEIARQLKNYTSNYNIKFIFFSAEESQFIGSKNYVLSLTDEEKSNIIGCINIDMVGEKDAGDLVTCTPQGLPTILNYVLDSTLSDYTFNSKLQGGSDHISFSIANIPAVTFDQPNRDISIMKKENQMDYLDSQKLKETAQIITELVTKYDFSIHENLLNSTFNLDLNSFNSLINDLNTSNMLSGFNLTNIQGKPYNNGVTSEVTYSYQNSQGEVYYIKQIPINYAPIIDLANYSQIQNIDNTYSYLTFYSSKSDSNIKLLVEGPMYLTEFSGDISTQQAIELMKSLS